MVDCFTARDLAGRNHSGSRISLPLTRNEPSFLPAHEHYGTHLRDSRKRTFNESAY